MKYKAFIACSLIAALLCVASIVFLAKEISDVSSKNHTISSIRLENFSFKIGRNFDELAHALVLHRDCRSPTAEMQEYQSSANTSSADYVEKFDIVWSGFKNAYSSISKYWATPGYWLDEDRAASAPRLRESGLEFLAKYQDDISIEKPIGCARINEMLVDIYIQKDAISEFSLGNFELKNKAAQEQQEGIENQYNSILFLAASFLATLLLAATLVGKALREASDSNHTSKVAGHQAMVASHELREIVNTNVAQSRFFAAASHDLRQPLHALGLYLGSLEKHITTPEARHILNCANLSTDSFSVLLDSLLDISRLDAGVISANKSELDVSSVLARMHRRFLPEATEKGLELVLKVDESWVFTDEQMLDRIIQNLLSNALNYTDNGYIEICCSTDNGYVLISITDTGSGIPEHKHEAVFSEFYQLRNKDRDSGKGIGLGLSIVQRLSNLLEVDLQMKSTVDVGTQFTLKLPVLERVVQHSRSSSAPENQPALKVDLTGAKILLIENDQDVRHGTTMILQGQNCYVRAAEDIETAVMLCESGAYTPDLILADYRLNDDRTGFEAIEILRQLLGRVVPAIIITGDTTVDFRNLTAETKLDVLYKPVDTSILMECIAILLLSP